MIRLVEFFKIFLSFFYPRCCLGCKKTLLRDENLLCLHCFAHLPETNYHLFPENPLLHVFWGRVKIERAASLLFYRKGNLAQSILFHLKYKRCKEIGDVLGDYYGKKLIEIIDFQTIDCIIPVPLHPKKKRLRGYNQSEWMAKGLSRSMGIPYYDHILIRTTFTETQTRKKTFNRWLNVKDAFQITDSALIRNKHILLCDDVITTGATVEAIVHKMMEQYGVRVSVVTLASVQ